MAYIDPYLWRVEPPHRSPRRPVDSYDVIDWSGHSPLVDAPIADPLSNLTLEQASAVVDAHNEFVRAALEDRYPEP